MVNRQYLFLSHQFNYEMFAFSLFAKLLGFKSFRLFFKCLISTVVLSNLALQCFTVLLVVGNILACFYNESIPDI